MQNNFTQLIAHFLSAKRYTVPAGALLLFLATSLYVWAAVGVTIVAGTGGATFPISADLAANATITTPAYSSVGNIAIVENAVNDISSTGNIILKAPTGWRFGGTAVTATAGAAPNENRGGVKITVGTPVTSQDGTQITIPVTNFTTDRLEQIVVSGVQVQALNGGNVPGTGSVVIGVSSGTAIDGLSTAINTPVVSLSQRAGTARKVGFTTQPGGALINANLNPQPIVAIQDQFGNTVTTSAASVTVAIGNNPGGGTLNGTNTVNAVNGVATFSDLNIDKAGTDYTLIASSGSLTTATSSAFTVNNPKPVITDIVECLSVGDPETTVTITGENFIQGATVIFNNVSRPATVTSSTTLTTVLSAADLATSGNKDVYVKNPTPASNNGLSDVFSKRVAVYHSLPINGPTSVCANQTDVRYYVNTGPNVSSHQWRIVSGDATVRSGGTPNADIRIDFGNTSGEVVLELIALNLCEKPSPATTLTVTVNPLPTAVIETPSVTESCVGSPITLTATPVAGATYQWYRGATAVTTAVSDNTYNADATGNYSVVVRYSGTTECAATSNTIGVTLKANPTATITQGATATYCAGSSTMLTAQESGNEYTYLWHLNDAPLTNQTARTLTVNAEGNYTVQVTRNGCSTMSAATTVTELPLPTAEITPASATEFCASGSVVLNATPGTGYTYKWFAEGSNTVLDSDGSFTASVPGNYYVVVTGSNNCTATSASVTVTVNQPPVATITATGPTKLCFGESVVLNAPEAPFGSTYSYEWKLEQNDIVTVVGATQSIEAEDEGTYTVRVINNETGCESTSAGTVIREGTLEFAIFTYTGATEFCQGGVLQLNAILPPNNQTTYSYRWIKTSGTVTEVVSTNSSYPVTTTGSYQVEITEVIDEETCIRTSTPLQVTVNPQPTASITSGSQSLCAEADGSTSFSVSGTFSGGTAVWSSNNTNFKIENPSYNASTGVATATVVATGSGDATISLTTSSTVAGCRDAAAAVVLNVKPLPAATITPRGATTFCQGDQVILDAPQGVGYTYQWYRDGNLLIGTGNSYAASITGNYYVIVTNNSCPVQSPNVAVTVNPLPTATIEADGPIVFCSGGSVTLNAVSDIGTSFTWFRDNVQVGTGLTYSANVSGSYTMRATVDGTTCSNLSAATVVNVDPTPEATITVTGLTTFCQNGSVLLQAPAAPDGRTYNYQWFNGATQITVSGTGRDYQAIASGNYTVRVTDVTTALNCSATTATPVAVTVNPLPTASISYTGSTTLCQGSSLLLTGNSDTGTSYIWYRDNVEVARTLTYAANQTGSYTVRATNGNNCTSNLSAAVQVTVNPTITGNTIAGAQTVCSGGTIAALGQASGTALAGGATPYEYQWQVSTNNSTWDDITTGGNAASYTPAVQTVTTATTTYYRRIVRGGNCSSESASVAVTVTPLPTLSFTGAIASTSTFYTGQGAVALTASPSGGTFSGPGVTGNINTGFTFNPCTAKAGTHVITYNYTSPDGARCSNSITKSVTVNQSTYRAVILANPHPFCRGGGGTTYTAAVYRDVQPGEIIYPYLVDANGNPVDELGKAIPKGSGSYPVPNPNYPYPNNTPESIKAMSYRFFQPRVDSIALAGRELSRSLFSYQWGKNDEVNRSTDDYQTKDAGLSSQDYYEVEVTGNLCSSVALESNRMYSAVLESYTVALSAAPNPICQGAAVTFTATLGAAFPWDVADLQLDFVLERGNVVLNPTTFTYTGSNTITFTTDAAAAGGFVNGDKVSARFTSNIESYLPSSNCIEGPASRPVTIQVNDIVALTPTDQSTTICLNSAVTFTAPVTTTGPATVTYTWTVGTKTYTTNTASLNVPAEITGTAGSYPVSVVVSNACETTSTLALGTLTVNPQPTATLTANDATTKCAGAGNTTTFSLTGTTTGGTEAWSFVNPSGGATAAFTTTTNPRTVTVTGTGSVTVRITSTNPNSGCTTAVQDVVLTVNPQPTATLTANDATTKCAGAGNTTTFSLTGTTTGGTEAWSFVNPSGGATAAFTTTTNPRTVTVTGTGLVTVRITSTNPNSGCTTAVQDVVLTVKPIIPSSGDITSVPAVPEVNESVTFTANSNIADAGDAESYKWYISTETGADGEPVWVLQEGQSGQTFTTITPSVDFLVRADVNAIDGACYTEMPFVITTLKITPLPVEILYLRANKKANDVLLEWATASEQDNKGFEVQVSEDGLNYRLLTFVPSKNGNSNTKQVYAFTDKENGKDGTRYYRLKQIDHAGTFEFFGPKVVTFDKVASKVIAFPNPFHDEVTLDIASETDGEMLIVVTDAVGKQLMQRKVQVESGFTTEKLKLDAGLPRGLYIIKTQIGGYTQFIKMIKE